MIAGQASTSKREETSSGFDLWRQKCEVAVEPGHPARSTIRSWSARSRRPLTTKVDYAPRTLFSTVECLPTQQNSNLFARWFPSKSTAGAHDARSSSSSTSAVEEIKSMLNIDEEETSTDRAQRETCEQYLNSLLRKSPMVRFMVKNLSLMGCSPLDEHGNVKHILIGKCPKAMAGGFSPHDEQSRSGLLICQNGIQSQEHMEATLAHEMIHWFDHCRFKVDWRNLRHIACSEIRAANLSGDCRFQREVFQRKRIGLLKQHQTCVRRRAVDSMTMEKDGPDRETAEKVVDEVWSSCFNDTRPFDEIY